MEKNIVLIRHYETVGLIEVYLNGVEVMRGINEDFHPFSKGVNEYGNFRGASDLVDRIVKKVGNCEIKEETYIY